MSSKLNLLIAFPYCTTQVVDLISKHQATTRFLLDSGAFTAWKTGKKVTVEDYCSFISDLPFKPWRYFNLDVIGDAEGSYKNYKKMLDKGFNPVPIFTRGENIKMVEEYYKTSDVLGIGGLVGTKGNRGFVKGIMEVVGNRKVHWLGFTNKNYVAYYKPYMCDSSSWEGGARYGNFNLYMGRGKYKTLKRENFKLKPTEEISRKLLEYNVDITELSKEKNWRGGDSLNRRLNAKSAVKESVEIEKVLGVKKFSAAATELAARFLIEAHKEEL